MSRVVVVPEPAPIVVQGEDRSRTLHAGIVARPPKPQEPEEAGLLFEEPPAALPRLNLLRVGRIQCPWHQPGEQQLSAGDVNLPGRIGENLPVRAVLREMTANRYLHAPLGEPDLRVLRDVAEGPAGQEQAEYPSIAESAVGCTGPWHSPSVAAQLAKPGK